MFEPASTYSMKDNALNDTRASAILLDIESCKTLGHWNALSQKAFWFLAALWNGNQQSYLRWADEINAALDEALERAA